MKTTIIATPRGLRGVTPQDEDAWRKFRARLTKIKSKGDGSLRIEFSSPRHLAHHRKLFALLQLVADCSEVYDTPERALLALKLATGFCDPLAHPVTGELLMIPRSISFESMGQDDFDVWYAQALDAVSTVLVPHLKPEARDAALDEITQGWL